MTTQEIVNSIPLYLGYSLGVASVIIWLYILLRKEGHMVLDHLKGEDGKWQIIELSGMMWLVIMPCMVVADLLGAHLTAIVWAAMDTVYLINIGGKAYLENIKNKKSDGNL